MHRHEDVPGTLPSRAVIRESTACCWLQRRTAGPSVTERTDSRAALVAVGVGLAGGAERQVRVVGAHLEATSRGCTMAAPAIGIRRARDAAAGAGHDKELGLAGAQQVVGSKAFRKLKEQLSMMQELVQRTVHVKLRTPAGAALRGLSAATANRRCAIGSRTEPGGSPHTRRAVHRRADNRQHMIRAAQAAGACRTLRRCY